MEWGSHTTYLGTTTLKEKKVSFGLKDSDRTKHFFVLGKTGSGRGDLLVSMALQDIARGAGVLFLDATGMSSTKLLERIDPADLERVVFLDPSDAEYPFSWNSVDDVRALPSDRQPAAFADLLSEMYHLPPSEFLDSTAALLLTEKNTTPITFYSLITDEKFRTKFFTEHAEAKDDFQNALQNIPEVLPTLNDQGKYVARDTLVRNLIGQRESKFTLSRLSEGQIVVVDFSRIRMYPTRMTPLVRMLVHGAWIAGEASRTPSAVYLHDTLRYLSEFEIAQSLVPDNYCAFTIADTIIQEGDFDRRVLALSRAASVASFVPHPADSVLVEKAFSPHAFMDDAIALSNTEFLIALSIDGIRSKPFFGHAAPLPDKKNVSFQDLIVQSRKKYATIRSKVDLNFVHEAVTDDDDGDEGGGTPHGFQDAFRNIFAKQAERAKQAIQPGGAPAVAAKEPGQPGALPAASAPPSGAEPKALPQGSTGTPASGKAQNGGEVSEDALKRMLYVAPVSILLFFLTPFFVLAAPVITEIMYDVSGTDTGREWIEIQNSGSETLSLDEWKFFENNTNHTLTAVSGTAVPPGGHAVIADNTAKFLADWPSFSGVLYESSFSLNNTGEFLAMRNADLADVDSVTYNPGLGGAGDGNTLQKSGSTWAAGPATPGLPFSAQATPPPSSPPPSQTPSQNSSPSPESETSGGSAPQPKTIYANAGPDRSVVAGADTEFEGTAIGLTGEPLEKARYVWSFGNGEVRDGQRVLYHFPYPGTYVVVLDVVSGTHNASDRTVIKAVPAALAISAVTTDYIALKNNGAVEVDVAGWILFSSGKQFVFPENTILLPGQEVFVTNARTGLSGTNPSTVALQYPNRLVATTFVQPLFSPEIASVPSESPVKKPEPQPEAARVVSVTEPIAARELVAAPVAAGASQKSGGSLPLAGWVSMVVTLGLVTGLGVVYVKRKGYNEYSVKEINE